MLIFLNIDETIVTLCAVWPYVKIGPHYHGHNNITIAT